MFTQTDFKQLQFLEGRWSGTGPDGKPFYEQYDFSDPATFRSQRFNGADFAKPVDGSTVTYKDGDIISRWGQFTWRASEIGDGKACFNPVEAPSSFCWQRVDATNVNVTQRWTGADGKEQTMTMALKRVGAAPVR